MTSNLLTACELLPLDLLEGPSDDEIWAIEAESELLEAEVALVDAEAAWLAEPSPRSAAEYVQALLDVVDVHHTSYREPSEAVA